MITDIIKQRYKTLAIKPDDAIVVGGSVLAVLGIRSSNDIDLMVKRPVFDRIAAKVSAVQQYPDGSGQITTGDVELMYQWQGKTYADFLPTATWIDGILVMSLADLRAWKLEQHRPKDLHDVRLIDAYMNRQSLL